MNKDPFALSGSELLNSSVGKRATPHKEIFAKPKVGGGGMGRVSKPVPTNQEPDEDLVPDAPKPVPPAETKVRLTNPKFLVPDAHFEDKVHFTIDAALPASMKDVKRVIVTVWSIPPHGEKQQAFCKDFYIDDDGKVTGEVELSRPSKTEGKEVESCPYNFTAKHRDSKEVESPKIKVKERFGGNEEVVLELPASDQLKKDGISFELKSKNGAIISKVEAKTGEEKEGNLSLKFEKIDSNLSYDLNMLDLDGKIMETIFKDIPFGEWTGITA
ncbi:MAG: hypothetical protein ABIW76_04710 [Fibrobacteria bacterium]